MHCANGVEQGLGANFVVLPLFYIIQFAFTLLAYSKIKERRMDPHEVRAYVKEFRRMGWWVVCQFSVLVWCIN